jgi:hypothetical protein
MLPTLTPMERLSLFELQETLNSFYNAKGSQFVLPVKYSTEYSDSLFSLAPIPGKAIGSNPTGYKVYFVTELGTLFEQTFSLSLNKAKLPVLKPGSQKALLKNVYSQDGDSKLPSFYALEKKISLDLDGDGLVGSSIVAVTSGSNTLSGSDLTYNADGFYEALALSANGKKVALTIDTSATSRFGSSDRIVIGTSLNSLDTDSYDVVDSLLSSHKTLSSSITAGFGTGGTGAITINNSDITLSGSLLSSYAVDLFQINSSTLLEKTLAIVGVGIGPRSNGSLSINDSSINFSRTVSYGDVATVDSEFESMDAVFFSGLMGGYGSTTISRSELNMLGLNNDINVGEEGGNALMSINQSSINLNARYSRNDLELSPGTDDSFGESGINIGNGNGVVSAKKSNLIVKSSEVNLLGTSTSFQVGRDGAVAAVSVTDSSIIQHGFRDVNAVIDGTIDIADYAYAWSGSYLEVGGDESDGNATTNNSSNGQLSLTNSFYSSMGPNTGISVGVGGTKAIGQIDLKDSLVSILAGGAMYDSSGQDLGWKSSYWEGAESINYLAAGVNSNGDWHSNYFAFVNVGGAGWKDFGGNGEINLDGSHLQLFQMDLNSQSPGSDNTVSLDDPFVDTNHARFDIGSAGTRGLVSLKNNSKLDIGGTLKLGAVDQDVQPQLQKMALWNDGGVINVTYFESLATPNSRGGFNQALTYLNGDAEINTERASFINKSTLIGDGTIRLLDVFSGDIEIFKTNYDNPDIFNDPNIGRNDLTISFDDAKILVGDILTIKKTGAIPTSTKGLTGTSTEVISSGVGTLNFQADSSKDTSIIFKDTTLKFDIKKDSSDLITISDYDQVRFEDCLFELVIDKSLMSAGNRFKVIDFDNSNLSGIDLATNSNQIKLIGMPSAELLLQNGDIWVEF